MARLQNQLLMNIKKLPGLILILLLTAKVSFAWNVDVEVSSVAPSGASSVAATSGGILYASVPQTSLNPSHAMSIYESTNNGASWTQLNTGAGLPGDTVKKSRMLVTGTDSVVCVFQIRDSIYTLHVGTGMVFPFTTLSAADFDVAASPTYNALYLFVDAATSNDLRRYSSADGGQTWTGSTALVAGDAANPKVYMSGTRLYLTYYGALQADIKNSKIVHAIYAESGAGNLASLSVFQDIVANNTIPKSHFQPVGVDVNNLVWFLWTEGTGPSVLKARVSLDNGVNFGTEFTIAGDVNINVERFDAKAFYNIIGSGVQITYYADSVQSGAADPFTESIHYITAQQSAPEVFSSPSIVSDHTVDGSSDNFNPVTVFYLYNLSETAGVLWVQDDGTGSSLFYDASSSIVSVNEYPGLQNSGLKVYPNPAGSDAITYLKDYSGKKGTLDIFDLNGRLVQSRQIGETGPGEQEIRLDLNGIIPGLYQIRISTEENVQYGRFVKAGN
jgi:hypothetical protein